MLTRLKISWWWVVFAILCIILGLSSCSKKSTKSESSPPLPPPTTTITVPFTEGFEAGIDSLQKLWYFWPYYPTAPGVGSQIFKPQSGGASGKQCMAGGASEGQNYGQYSGTVYGGSAVLQIRKDIDLSTVTSCNLLFYNTRSVQTKISPPSVLDMPENDSRCFVEISINSGGSWSTLTKFNSSVSSWELETISLNNFVGLKTVRLRFRIPPHCVDGKSSPSTQWKIDDINLTGG
jgi:hypothetical protein